MKPVTLHRLSDGTKIYMNMHRIMHINAIKNGTRIYLKKKSIEVRESITKIACLMEMMGIWRLE